MTHNTNEYGFFVRESDVKIGERVNCNGYLGTIIKVHDGQLKGMVDVRLGPQGACCVGISELKAPETVEVK